MYQEKCIAYQQECHFMYINHKQTYQLMCHEKCTGYQHVCHFMYMNHKEKYQLMCHEKCTAYQHVCHFMCMNHKQTHQLMCMNHTQRINTYVTSCTWTRRKHINSCTAKSGQRHINTNVTSMNEPSRAYYQERYQTHPTTPPETRPNQHPTSMKMNHQERTFKNVITPPTPPRNHPNQHPAYQHLCHFMKMNHRGPGRTSPCHKNHMNHIFV